MSVESQQPSIVFQPQVQRGLQRGIDQLATLIGLTLGPHARTVAVERTIASYSPSLLDDGGVIARRIIQLGQRDADTGAMFLRHVLWNVHERAGDGVATTAVLFQSLFNDAARYLAAGGDAMGLRRHLERAAQTLIDEIGRMSTPVCGPEQLAQLAESVCQDAELAGMLGEIFDVLGADGLLDIRAGRGRAIQREYIEGRYWPGAALSPLVLNEAPGGILRLEHIGVVVGDCAIDDPADLAPALRLAVQAGYGGLLIVAQQISDRALGYLHMNREHIPAAVVRVPGATPEDQLAALEDLALLSGGRPIVQVAGRRLGSLRAADLGQARRAWADQHSFGLAGGAADPRALRVRLAQLRAAYEAEERAQRRDAIQQRIGRLLGGSATLWIGGATESEIAYRTAMAERAARVLRGAMRSGVVPGGGAALLACGPLLRQLRAAAAEPEERVAYTILQRAVEAPFRALATNAGYTPGEILARLGPCSSGDGFDVRAGQVADMRAAGILDSAGVLQEALRSAITSAALALTIDVVIHPRAPVVATEP